MDSLMEKKLISCLEAMEEGKSIDQALAQYPEDELELRDMLETHRQLSSIRVAHSLEAKTDSRRRFLAQAESLRKDSERPKAAVGFLGRFAFSFGALAVILIVLGAAVITASASALPGDSLYGTKRAVEDLRLSLIGDPQERTLLNDRFGQERIREVNAILIDRREVEVDFRGAIESLEGDTWIVAGVAVEIGDATEIDGEPLTGRLVRVNGKTAGGILTAIMVTIYSAGEDLPEPIPTAPIRISPTEEVDTRPTLTPSPTPQPTPTPEATSTATETSTATPTATSTQSLPEATTAPTTDADTGGDDDSEDDLNEDETEDSPNDENEEEHEEDEEDEEEHEEDEEEHEDETATPESGS